MYKRVDTCAAEFATLTAYLYSTYEEECEAQPTNRAQDHDPRRRTEPYRPGNRVRLLLCARGACLREDGFETIMVNCNPETVSTDYDTSDRLYFEPLTLEDVLEILAKEKPEGVIVQFGGQTPLKLSRALEEAGAPIIGTSPDSIDVAEDRERFQQLVRKLGLKQPANATARTEDQAVVLAREVGFPLVVRPSYVLGGRAMEIVFNEEDLRAYMGHAVQVSNDSPVLLDRFLDVAIEVDVDAVCDGEEVLIGGIMEHVEQAGVHSGDSGCCLPPNSLTRGNPGEPARSDAQARQGALGRGSDEHPVCHPEWHHLRIGSQPSSFAHGTVRLQGDWPAAREDRGAGDDRQEAARSGRGRGPRAALLFGEGSGVPVRQIPRVRPDPRPGNEVHGRGDGNRPDLRRGLRQGADCFRCDAARKGVCFISVRDRDKPGAVELARRLIARGFEVVATEGTARA